MSVWENYPTIELDPEKVSGAWVFFGTRIPVASLFENLRDGATVDRFLDWFPVWNHGRSKASLTTKPEI